eukprot:Gb_19187 [translate_table: standard]
MMDSFLQLQIRVLLWLFSCMEHPRVLHTALTCYDCVQVSQIFSSEGYSLLCLALGKTSFSTVNAEDKWSCIGKYRSHVGAISGLHFAVGPMGSNRLFSIGFKQQLLQKQSLHEKRSIFSSILLMSQPVRKKIKQVREFSVQ